MQIHLEEKKKAPGSQENNYSQTTKLQLTFRVQLNSFQTLTKQWAY